MVDERTDVEVGAEAGPSRPRRSRQAPQKYDSSQHAGQHKRERNTRSASASTRLARLNDELEREAEYLAKYTYEHVGVATEEQNPTVWIDTPDLPDINSYPKTLSKAPVKKRKRKTKDTSDAEPSSKRAAPTDMPLITEQETDIAEHDAHEVEAIIDTPHTCLQDRPNSASQPLASLQSGEAPSTSDLKKRRIMKRKEGDESTESDQLRMQASVHAASPRLVSAPNSPSPMHFVDASEDFPLLLPNATEAAMKVTPVYHPEMRLSHDKREGSNRKSPMRSSAPVTSREVKKRKGSHVGPPLFLGSDGEEESYESAQQQLVNGSTTKLGSGMSLTLSTALLDSKGDEADTPASKPTNKSSPTKRKSARATVSPNPRAGPSKSPNKTKPLPNTNKKSGNANDAETPKGSKKRGARSRSANGIDYGVVCIASSSDDDLVQNLNVDNYVKSTGNGDSKSVRAKHLERLKKLKEKAERRRQGQDTGESVSSGSDAESESSSEDSEEIDEDNFIVDDTSRSSISRPIEVVHLQAQRTLSPPPLSVPKYRAYVARLDRKGKLQEYLRWSIIYALDIPIEKEDDTRLKAVRQDLQDDFRMKYGSLLTQANRQQFTWYLTHFPHFERRQMTKREKEDRIGCHACQKKSQRCEYAFTFWGIKYNQKTLEIWSDDHHTSSLLSTGEEDLKTVTKDEKKEKRFTFFLGETCAQYASVKHKLYHWERRVLQDVIKLPEYKVLKRKDTDDIGGEHIETVVSAYIKTLMNRYTRLENDARDLVTKNTVSRPTITDRWDLD